MDNAQQQEDLDIKLRGIVCKSWYQSQLECNNAKCQDMYAHPPTLCTIKNCNNEDCAKSHPPHNGLKRYFCGFGRNCCHKNKGCPFQHVCDEDYEESIYNERSSKHIHVIVERDHPMSYYEDHVRRVIRLQDELYVGGSAASMYKACRLIELLKRKRITEIDNISTGMYIEPTSQTPRAFITFRLKPGEFGKFVPCLHQRVITQIFETLDQTNEGTLPMQKIETLQFALKFKADEQQTEAAKKFLSVQNVKKLNLPSFIKYMSILIHPLLKDRIFLDICCSSQLIAQNEFDGNDGSSDCIELLSVIKTGNNNSIEKKECKDDEKNENIKCKYFQDAVAIIKKEFDVPDSYFYQNQNMCYCSRCHAQRGDKIIYSRGGSKYGLPIGWCRIGLKTNAGFCKMNSVWDKWHVAFHGTSKETVPLIFKGDLKLLKPGDIAVGGGKIGVVKGHIMKSFSRTNLYTGKQEILDPNQIFLSPSIKYAGCNVYSKWSNCGHPTKKDQNIRVKFAFQARIRPGAYGIGQETIGATKRKEVIDANFKNNLLEWYTKEHMGILLYGLLVKFE